MSEAPEVSKNNDYEVIIKPEYYVRTERTAESEELPAKKKVPSDENEAGDGATDNAKQDGRRNYIPPYRQYCKKLLEGKECGNKNCTSYHSMERYIKIKQKPEMECYNIKRYGTCKYGINCMFEHEGVSIPEHPEPSCEYKNAFTVNDTAGFRKSLQNYKSNYSKKGRYMEKRVARDEDRKTLDLDNKLMLAPMATVGNVAFRRLCISFGADVTCSEFVMAKSFVKGLQSEFARVKRHSDEKIFGVNIAGSGHDIDTAAPFLSTLDCDFFELNACCPDPSIIRDNAGSFILTGQSKFNAAVNAIMRISYNYETIRPYTIKSLLAMNTGNGDVLQSRIQGAFKDLKESKSPLPSHVIGHGRYAIRRTASAIDWDSIKLTANYCMTENVGFVPNGDIFQYSDLDALQCRFFNGAMIGRGALVKPWIFKEIKEKRVLDPNSTERMEYLKTFAGYLLDAFGSDYIGRERSRTQFLENYSWMARYVPVGILERPQHLNDRVGLFNGRDEMETLMGKSDIPSWIKLSEYLFGRTPEGFRYATKY